ncbi:hypothetical protein Celaphus_00013869 [Cervus elaphus hippelaphus]|uniref:Uncharacterized protein n=1 Tax=Cervus elaphus hippelaphus TaxID=46360 RepID=A0A212CD80_CEREH|nr:hypothetical protein Celaphus_00013869 [Cervus elaphus hippelaphus]
MGAERRARGPMGGGDSAGFGCGAGRLRQAGQELPRVGTRSALAGRQDGVVAPPPWPPRGQVRSDGGGRRPERAVEVWAGRRGECGAGGPGGAGSPRRGPARVQSRRDPRGQSGFVRTRQSGGARPGPGVRGGSGGQQLSGRRHPGPGRALRAVSAGRARRFGRGPKRRCGRASGVESRLRLGPLPPAARIEDVVGEAAPCDVTW